MTHVLGPTMSSATAAHGTLPRTTRSHATDDRGAASVFALGWVVIVLIAALVVAVATDVHVQRMRLLALADQTVLEAVGNAPRPPGDVTQAVHLTESHIRQSAAATLAAHPEAWVADVAVTDASAADTRSASVTLARTVPLLFNLDALAPWSDGMTLEVNATARAS